MENKAEPSERARNTVYYAFLAAPFVYLVLIYELYTGKNFDYVWGDSMPEFTYLMLAISFITIALAKPLRNRIFEAKKKSIRTVHDFNVAYFQSNCIGIAFLEASSVYGLLIFFLTGGLVFPLFMIGLPIAAMLVSFPRRSEKEEKMKQFHFDELKQ